MNNRPPVSLQVQAVCSGVSMKLYLEKILTGGIVLLLSLLMRSLVYSQIQVASLTGVSPRAIPLLVANCITFLAIIVMGQGGVHFFIEKKTGNIEYSRARFQAFPFFLFALMLSYALMMVYTGYFIASFIILPLMMYVLRVRKVKSYLIMAGLIIFIFLVIDVFLNIRLPKIGLFGIL